PGRDPIGSTIRIETAGQTSSPGDSVTATVVGLSGDIISGLIVDGPEPGHIYLPTAPGKEHARAILARARGSRDLTPEPLQDILRRAVVDPEVYEALPLEEVRTLQVYPFMAASWIGSLLGVVALALSVSGLFGVLTYTLRQRSKEIGIRMALGATSGAAVSMVMRQTAVLAGVGAIAGLAGAFGLLQILTSTVRLRA